MADGDENDNELVQLVDGNGEMDTSLTDVMSKWKFTEAGFDYHVLAILGPQSGGKSTLLNMLFNTAFVTMDANKGRGQTTLGIWLGKADKNNTLVLDLEGTDSKERGEYHVAFERKTGLFSLALAEILIVNMFETDLGKFHGSNYALLNTVFELNLQLFQKQKKSRTKLLFCVRDQGESPLEILRQNITNDMYTIWKDIKKPAEFVDSNVEDFFEFCFVALPHKKYQAKEFAEECAKLKDRFANPQNPDYLWSDNFQHDVPADGFPQYAANIWEVIKVNKDLDLPTQKEMLAEHRCEQISREAFSVFEQGIAPFRETLKAGSIAEEFGPTINQLIQTAKQQYAEPAARYLGDVSVRRGEELHKQMLKEVEPLYRDQLSKLRKQAGAQFESELNAALPKGDAAVEKFGDIVTGARTGAIGFFDNGAETSQITGVDWSAASERLELEQTLEKRIEMEIEKQMRNMMEYIKKSLKRTLEEPFQCALDDSKPDMWSELREIRTKSTENAKQVLQQRLESFGCPADEVESKMNELNDVVDTTVNQVISTHGQNLFDLLVKRFEKQFKYDSNGLPKRWRKDDNVAGTYRSAFDSTKTLIDLHSINRLDEQYANASHFSEKTEVFPEEIVVLSKRECMKLEQRFKEHGDAMFSAARDEQERSLGNSQLTYFLVAVFLFFAYDDLWAYIQNPFWFMLTLLFGGGFAVLWYLDMLHTVKPVLTTFTTVIRAQLAQSAKPKTD